MSSATDYDIVRPSQKDFDQWSALFRAYIDFYESSIDEAQYHKTFDRIIDEENDLQALVVKRVADGKLVGIAHFFPEQTPWSEKQIMLLNDLFVDPSIRGQGLGRRLTKAVAAVAKEKGCLRLQWLTKHNNTTARALYDTLAESQFVQYRMKLD